MSMMSGWSVIDCAFEDLVQTGAYCGDRRGAMRNSRLFFLSSVVWRRHGEELPRIRILLSPMAHLSVAGFGTMLRVLGDHLENINGDQTGNRFYPANSSFSQTLRHAAAR